MDRVAAVVLAALLPGSAFAVGVFNSTYVDQPLPTSFERVGNASRWTFGVPGGGASQWTIGAQMGTQTLGRTFGVGASGAAPSLMSQATLQVGKVATALKPAVAWPVVKSSVNAGVLALAKVSPVVSVASMGVFAYQMWQLSGMVNSGGQIGLQAPAQVPKEIRWRNGTSPNYRYGGTPVDAVSAYCATKTGVRVDGYPPATVYTGVGYLAGGSDSAGYNGSCGYAGGGYSGTNLACGSACFTSKVTECPTGYNWNGTICVYATGEPPITPLSDSEALAKLDAVNDPNPAGTVKDVITKGQPIQVESPQVSGPPTVEGPKETSQHPDGTKTETNTFYNIDYQGDTITVTEVTTVQNYNTDESPDGSPEVTEKPPEEQAKTDCEKNPGYLACWEQGTDPGPVTVQSKEIPIDLTPQPLAGSASCPAPIQLSAMGFAVEWSFQPICDFATGIHFAVIAMGWLAAGLLVFGPIRGS